jgi:DNA-binding NarL/FixJ family response regulator
MGYVIDISTFKQNDLIYHTIDEIDLQQPNLNRRRLEENIFHPNEEDRILSKREICILSYLAEGLCSKQIADKLKISENTIANHRKNMLRKTNSKNVAQLIVFGCKNKLI